MSYGTVRTAFPNAPCTFDDYGLCEVEDLQDPDGEFANFRYTIRKQYSEPNGEQVDSSTNDGSDTGMMQITVEVSWGGDDFDDNIHTYRQPI